MIWQDMVMTGAQLIFAVSVIPQIVYGFKEKKGFIRLATSIPMFIAICALTFSLFTLSLVFSAMTTTLTGMLWLILIVQRLTYEKP
ncbi:hypothetical protein J4401_06615 [Candidatus Woesearchaeota archaeon]|nr:hypothetical protein [Candidatus Woesearchaeota archaeon]